MDQLVLAQELLEVARSKGARIAVAESCTGGLLAGAITEVPGASDIFERGFVTYTNIAKVEMLDVNSQTLDTHGAVSQQVAVEMAKGAMARSTATITLSITGIAGPGASDHKPEGRVCFALARTGSTSLSETVEFGAVGRSEVRKGSVDHALRMLIAALA